MIKKPIFLMFAFLMSLTLACGFNFSTANLQNARLAKDAEGTQPTTVFNQDEDFYLVADLENAPDDTKVKAVWTAVEADGVDPNFSLGEKELTSGSGQLNFNLTNEQLWPAGSYKVELYMNDELKQTLEFTVEGDVAAVAEEEPTATPEPAEPTATPEPTETPEPPTATPEPTETPEPEEPAETPASSSGDTLGAEATEEEPAEGVEEEGTEEEPEPLPFQDEPYVHPSGAFTFAVPEGWEVASEDETSATLGTDEAAVGAVFVDIGAVLSEEEMQAFIDTFTENFVSAFGDDYEIIEQKPQPDDSIYVALSYSSDEGNGDIDFFFEQRQTVVFVLYFATTMYNELQPTWDEIIATYAVDPEAALAAVPAAATPAPAATATPAPPPPPTATPVPVVNPLAPPAGRSRLFVFNEFGQELIFTINNQQHTIPTGGFDNMIPIDLDPGRYTYTISLPGGGAANGEVTMAANESWAVGVRGDSAVYNPIKVYPE